MRPLAAPTLLAAVAAAQTPALSDLPLPPPVDRVAMFTSRDPSGGNQDWGHFPDVQPDGRAVLARAAGPGSIRRIWSADPRGDLEIRLDGEVAFAGAFAQLFDGTEPGFAAPLAGPSGGGCTSWVPMPFLRACEVTAPRAESIYYQIEIAYGAQAQRFAADAPDLATARARLVLPPQRGDDVRTARAGDGEPIALDGAGEVVCLRVRLHADVDLRRPWIAVHSDGEPLPCLSGPVALVFGLDPDPPRDGTAPAKLQTLVTADGDGGWRELRLPMPFRAGLRVIAEGVAALEAEWRPLPADHARRTLHGRFHFATTRRGEPFVALDARGPGHLVGVALACAGASGHGLSFLEGDESIAVDGDDAWCGTGTEDFFSGAWYFRGGPFAHPFHAVATIDGDAARAVMARWLIADPIPFARSLHFAIEHGGRNDAPGCQYAAMTFWYADAAGGRRDDADERAAWLRPAAIPQPGWARAADLWPTRARERHLVDVGPDDRAEVPPRWTGPVVVTLFDTHSRRVARFVTTPEAGLRPPTALRDLVHVRFEPLLPAVRSFRVAGPFLTRTPHLGVDDEFGPERDARPDARYGDVAGDGPDGWRRLTTDDWTGYVDLNAVMRPDDGVVAYAALTLRTDAPRRVRLVLGSDDSVKVWLAGRVVHRHVGRRGSVRDQDEVALELPAGESLVLIKVEDWDGGFGFHARLEDAAGVTVDDGMGG